MINSYMEKLKAILSLNKGGDNSKIDSVPERQAVSVFLQENAEALAKEMYDDNTSLKTYIENLINQYIPTEKTGSRLSDNGYGEEIYTKNTYEFSKDGYKMQIEVRPNADNSDYIVLLDFFDNNGNKIESSWKKYFNSFMDLNAPAPNGENELYLLCTELSEKYGISSFNELCQFIKYDVNNNAVSFKPRSKVTGEIVEVKEVSSTGNTTKSHYASNVGNIEGGKAVPIEPFTDVTEENFLYSSVFALLLNSLNMTEESLMNQLDESSYFTALSEVLRSVVGYGENLEDVKASINKLRSVLTILREDLEINNLEKFEKDFAENFGTEIKPEAIIKYAENVKPYTQKCALFETKSSLEFVINDITSALDDSAPDRDISDTIFNKYFNNILQLMGCENSDFMEDLDYIASERAKRIKGNDFIQYGFNNRSNKEKMACLRDYANIKITECNEIIDTLLNGQTLEDVRQEHHNLYAAAFGEKFDALDTVERYCELQQIGTTLTKGVALLIASIAMTASAGSAGLFVAPFIMYGADATINIVDESTKTKAIDVFNNEGFEEYCNYIVKNVPWTTIHENAKNNAILSLPFLGMNCAIMNICTKAGIPILATMTAQTAANVGLGSVIEYGATGEITIDGVIYIVTMDIIGHTVSLKNIKRKPSQPKVTKTTQEVSPITNVNEQAAQGFLTKLRETGIAHSVAKVDNFLLVKFRTNMFNAGKATYVLMDAEGNAISRPFTANQKGLGAKLKEAGIENDNNFSWEKTESAVYNPQNMAKAGMSAAALLTGIFGDISAAGGVAMAAMPILSLSGKAWNSKMLLPKYYVKKIAHSLKPNKTPDVKVIHEGLLSDKNKTVKEVQKLIESVAKKYGFNYFDISDRFFKGLNTNLKIFDSPEAIEKYIWQCYKLTNATKNGKPAYYRHMTGIQKTIELDYDLIKDIALLCTDSRMMSTVHKVCRLYECDVLDFSSLKNIISYLHNEQLSPATIDFTLQNLNPREKHAIPTDLFELESPSAQLKKQRTKIIDTLQRIHPELETDFANLKKLLGNDIYKVKWEIMQSNNYISASQLKQFIKDIPNLRNFKNIELHPENYFIKIDGYGKNESWARKMEEITRQASTMQLEGASSDQVLAFISAETREFNIESIEGYGTLRCKRKGYNIDPTGLQAVTPFDCKPYSAYTGKFMKHYPPNELHNPYPNIMELTRVLPHYKKYGYEYGKIMLHPSGKHASGALDLVNTLHSRLMNKYRGKNLSSQDLNEINETIGEIHWIMAHSMPWHRGSDAITNAFVKSIYQTLGIKTYAPREGLSFDLEAFCTELVDYKKLYSTYYERPPEIKNSQAPIVQAQTLRKGKKYTHSKKMISGDVINTKQQDIIIIIEKTPGNCSIPTIEHGLSVKAFKSTESVTHLQSNGELAKNIQYLLNPNGNLPILKLPDGTFIDLNLYKESILKLKDGKCIDIQITSGPNINYQFIIGLRNKKFVLQDFSPSNVTIEYKLESLNSAHEVEQKASQQKTTKPETPKQAAVSPRELAIEKFNKDSKVEYPPVKGTMDANTKYILDRENLPEILLCDGTPVDLSDWSALINNLGEGEYITIGRGGDIRDYDFDNTISKYHLIIKNENGQLLLKDVSRNGKSLYMSREAISAELKKEAFKKYNPDKPLSKIEKGKLIDKRYQYELKMYGDNKLPKLRLCNGEEIDLNLQEYRFKIEYLSDGDYITIGRDGDIKIKDNTGTISRHHLLIVNHNGVLILKDISGNGETYVI